MDNSMLSTKDMVYPLIVGAALRAIAIYVGIFIDSGVFGQLQYTDIDYSVFSSAARLCYQGSSPFEVATYRYPSVIACTLFYPQLHFSIPEFGKLLFCMADLGVMLEMGLVVAIMEQRAGIARKRPGTESVSLAMKCAWFWCFNVCSINISSRGSFDSISNFLLLLCVRVLYSSTGAAAGAGSGWSGRSNAAIAAAAVLYAGLVYLRLYPVIYLPTILVFILTQINARAEPNMRGEGCCFRCLAVMAPHQLQWRSCAVFVLVAGLTYAALVSACYDQFGVAGVQQSILYHFGRSDHRHNFAPHFLEAFLSYGVTSEMASGGMMPRLLQSLAGFAPQGAVIALLALRCTHESFPATLLLQTMVFVGMNRVCTAQYFMWYMCLLPVAFAASLLQRRARPRARWLSLLPPLWLGAVGLWLLCAYQLEFCWELLCDSIGMCEVNMFALVWYCSLLFYAVNIVCIAGCIAFFFE